MTDVIMTVQERDEKLAKASKEINAWACSLGVRVVGIISLPDDPEHVSTLTLHDCNLPNTRKATALAISEAAEVMVSYANDLWAMTDKEWNSLKESSVAKDCEHTQH